MPRLPRLRIAALAELARQLRFEPAEAARRQLVRAEELGMQVLREVGGGAPRTYPEDFVVFRITGYRADSESDAAPNLLAGEALLGDLAALIERLSAQARITEADLRRPAAGGGGSRREDWQPLSDLAGLWNVSRKTLERYRRMGLFARRIHIGRGRQRLMVSASAAAAFASLHRARLEKAGAFSRIDPAERDRLVRRAGRYKSAAGLSLDRAAARLARRSGRGRETVRQVLRKADRRTDKPMFPARGPITDSESRQIERAAARGTPIAELAAAHARSRATIHRVLAEQRAARLRKLDLSGPVGPTFGRADAEEVLLAPPAVRTGLGRPAPATIADCIEHARNIEPDAAIESARAVAYWLLRHEAARLIAALPKHNPPAAALDEIETRLRWASRLKAELVRSQLGLALRTITSVCGMGVEQMAHRVAAEALDAAAAALIDGVDKFDPFGKAKGAGGAGRLAAPAAVAVNRAVSAWLRRHGPDISPRAGGGGGGGARPAAAPRLADWSREANPWQHQLDPPADFRTSVDSGASGLDADTIRVLRVRLGWTPEGAPPRTIAQTAASLGLSARRVTTLQRAAVFS